MLENTLIEMATQAKSSVRRIRKLKLVLVYLFICVNQSQGFTSIYESADHYWPMKNISDNTSLDTIDYMHADIMNGAKLNDTKLFGPAVILDGHDQWISLSLMNDDCTNTPSKCRDGFTISFWLYYIGGEFILCAGVYNVGDKGPGIKFTVDDKLFVIEISTLKSTWKITSKLVIRTWVHVAFKWSSVEDHDYKNHHAYNKNKSGLVLCCPKSLALLTGIYGYVKGIHLYLNGNSVQQRNIPPKQVSFASPEYGRGWKLGMPNMVLKLANGFGHFGIAHLAQWQRELTADEIKAAFYGTILEDQKKFVEILETPEHPTNQQAGLKASEGPRSGAVHSFNHVKCWLVASILFLLFS